MRDPTKLKMYILVKDSLSPGMAACQAAHAAVACVREFQAVDEMEEWFYKSFRKVICTVTDEEFEEAKRTKNCCVMTEDTMLDDAGKEKETAIAFCPRYYWPDKFLKYRMMQ